MNISQHLDLDNFLKTTWQKKTLLLRQAFIFEQGLISADELAGLACEETVESRIVFANESETDWECEYGYFDESRFSELANNNWTLLVQSVDSYSPVVAELRDKFNFIPKWRLDDVMLSYATKGGGVGPHFDYYDVFLLQTSGSREWKIGQRCDSNSPLRAHEDLKLLKEFTETDTYILEQGDMLYIPAGVAHWGTALSDDCITASIGFRAPSHRELLQGAIEELAHEFKDDQRYTDIDNMSIIDEYLIDDSVKNQLSPIWEHLNKESFIEILTDQLAVQVTEVRDDSFFENHEYSINDIKNFSLRHHHCSRFAYRKFDSKSKKLATLFVNGAARKTDLNTALAICHSDYSKPEQLDYELITELINLGYLLRT